MLAIAIVWCEFWNAKGLVRIKIGYNSFGQLSLLLNHFEIVVKG
jgi:hypothetical protein